MAQPHWNQEDPAGDDSYPRVEAALPGDQDEFPAEWGEEPTERDQAAFDSGAADEALFQGLIDQGWTPPAPGAHAAVDPDADPATAQIDADPVVPGENVIYIEDGAADGDISGYPHWD